MPALPTSAMQTVILMDRPLVSNSRILFFISSQESQVDLVLLFSREMFLICWRSTHSEIFRASLVFENVWGSLSQMFGQKVRNILVCGQSSSLIVVSPGRAMPHCWPVPWHYGFYKRSLDQNMEVCQT